MEKVIQVKKLFNSQKWAKDAGYALFVGTGVLCIVSFLCMSLVALSRVKIENLEIQSAAFYKSLNDRNERIISDWKNHSENEEELKSFETN